MKPSVGRIVHYHPGPTGSEPEAAIVTRVHNDTCVNLVVFGEPTKEGGPDGIARLTSVVFGEGEGCWSWPPRV